MLIQMIASMFFTTIGVKILPLFLIMLCLVIFLIVSFLAMLSYNVRRLHDAGMSGWWCLAYFIAGAVLIGVSLVMTPTPGANQYGPDPRTSSK
ncbi:DUF805 domain-containing protein [Gilliamella sp. Pas-s27]|nr:DUF805 domain-containing protein [Gilliamella sp. Pas-s27]